MRGGGEQRGEGKGKWRRYDVESDLAKHHS